jgi:hypothetical protein
MIKQVLIAAERESATGWHLDDVFAFRATNAQLGKILDKLGEAVAPGSSPAAQHLWDQLGGVPAKYRRIGLPALLSYDWDRAETRTIYVRPEELDRAQRGHLPDVWADGPLDDCSLPIPFPLTPRMLAGRFLQAPLGHLRSLVDEHIPGYPHVRIVAALVS